MNKSELIRTLAEERKISMEEATDIVKIFFDSMKEALKNGNIEDIRAEIEAYITLEFYIWLYFVRVFELERSKGEKLLFRLL